MLEGSPGRTWVLLGWGGVGRDEFWAGQSGNAHIGKTQMSPRRECVGKWGAILPVHLAKEVLPVQVPRAQGPQGMPPPEGTAVYPGDIGLGGTEGQGDSGLKEAAGRSKGTRRRFTKIA